MSNKILRHPDKEDIVKKLLDGESVKAIESWLKDKYPKRDSLHVSYVTLQKFRKENLNLHGDVLESIKNARIDAEKDASRTEAQAILAQSDSYQKKINEIADTELDVTRKLKEMDALVTSRLEFYYNALASGTGDIKHDKVFLEYLNMYKGILQDWKKYIDGVADKTIEHNININIVNKQVNVLKGVVFEVLQDLDPTLVPLFVEKINQKMLGMEYDSEEYRQFGVMDAEFTETD